MRKIMKTVTGLEYAPKLAGDLFLPDGQAPDGGFPAVLLIHGGLRMSSC